MNPSRSSLSISVAGRTLSREGQKSRTPRTASLGGLKIPLGTLGGANSSVLWPNKNVFGQIVGVAETAKVDPNGELWSCSGFFAPVPATLHQCLGFVWQFGHMSALSTLGGNNGFAAAENDLGKVVGWSETSVHDPTCSSARGTQVLQFLATRWGVNGKAHALPMFQSDPGLRSHGNQ